MKKQNKNAQTQTHEHPAQAAAQHEPQLPTEEQIRQRAHEIYLARGGSEGLALHDWLAAEQELKEKYAG